MVLKEAIFFSDNFRLLSKIDPADIIPMPIDFKKPVQNF